MERPERFTPRQVRGHYTAVSAQMDSRLPRPESLTIGYWYIEGAAG